MAAYTIPVSRTSAPKTAVPFILLARSSRGGEVPTVVAFVLRTGSRGSGSLIASPTTSRKPRRRPERSWLITPPATLHSAAEMFHRPAAAEVSISRAAAADLRSGAFQRRTIWLPEVFCIGRPGVR